MFVTILAFNSKKYEVVLKSLAYDLQSLVNCKFPEQVYRWRKRNSLTANFQMFSNYNNFNFATQHIRKVLFILCEIVKLNKEISTKHYF